MTNEELLKLEINKQVDARAMACPGPLLEAKKSMGDVKVGEILEIWSGDQNTENNLERWCKKLGHEFLGAIDEGGYTRLFVKRMI